MVGVADVGEGDAAVDDGFEVAGFGEGGEFAEVFGAFGGGAGDDAELGGHADPRCVEQRCQVTEHEQQTTTLRQRSFATRVGSGTNRVHDQIVGLAVLREVDLVVVDDLVGTERGNQVAIAATAHRRGVGAEVLGELNRRGTDTTRGAVDQHTFTRLELAPAKEIQRGGATEAQGRGFGEAEVGGLVRDRCSL